MRVVFAPEDDTGWDLDLSIVPRVGEFVHRNGRAYQVKSVSFFCDQHLGSRYQVYLKEIC